MRESTTTNSIRFASSLAGCHLISHFPLEPSSLVPDILHWAVHAKEFYSPLQLFSLPVGWKPAQIKLHPLKYRRCDETL